MRSATVKVGAGQLGLSVPVRPALAMRTAHCRQINGRSTSVAVGYYAEHGRRLHRAQLEIDELN